MHLETFLTKLCYICLMCHVTGACAVLVHRGHYMWCLSQIKHSQPGGGEAWESGYILWICMWINAWLSSKLCNCNILKACWLVFLWSTIGTRMKFAAYSCFCCLCLTIKVNILLIIVILRESGDYYSKYMWMIPGHFIDNTVKFNMILANI